MLLICQVMALLATPLWGQSGYYCNDVLVDLEPVNGKALVELRRDVMPNQRTQILDETRSLSGVTGVLGTSGRRTRLAVSGTQVIQRAAAMSGVEYVANYFRTVNGDEVAPSNLLILKLRSLSDTQRMLDEAAAHDLSLLRGDKYNERTFVFRSSARTTDHMLSAAKMLYETGLYEYVQPNFVRTVHTYSNDPFFASQWNLENTGQGGATPDADIDAPEAWGLTRGNHGIKIAVVDEGVQLDHPDLVDNLLVGYDASGNGTDGGPVNGGVHGTMVAGIIGALADNGIGVAGVAPECSILPVSLDLSIAGYSDLEGADAINWAWDEGGADVINLSWGWRDNPSPYIADAITNAVENGRGGLGCIVIVAAGNENESSLSFPADLPDVIGTGATDMCDQRLDPYPCDGNGPFQDGSNRGIALDLVAPGYKVWTTTTGSGYASFGGTSAAAPHVAGVAGLILSVNPCLTHEQVKNILYYTTDKPAFVSSWSNDMICYQSIVAHPCGSWNNEMGYGRVNAMNAVRASYLGSIEPHWNETGTTTGPNNCSGSGCGIEFTNAPCANVLAAGFYIVQYYTIEKWISYTYRPNPHVISWSNGLSWAVPNDGRYWCGVDNVTPTSARLYTYAFMAVNILGQQTGWIGNSPSSIRFNYAVVGQLNSQEELQNETLVDAVANIRSSGIIISGKEITTTVPYGPYKIIGQCNVDLFAADAIRMEEGTELRPSGEGKILARVGIYATCAQYPEGLKFGGLAPIGAAMEHKVERVPVVYGPSLRIAPNPSGKIITLVISVKESINCDVNFVDVQGRSTQFLHGIVLESGTNYVELDVSVLPQGMHVCLAQLSNGHVLQERLLIVR